MMTLRKLFSLMTPAEQGKIAWLCGLVVVIAFFEVAAVFSVLPFLSIAADPDLLQTSPLRGWVPGDFSKKPTAVILVQIGLVSLLLLALAAVVRIAGQYVLISFAQNVRHSLAARLMISYLGRPYTFFLQRNSSELAKRVLDETQVVLNHALIPCGTMLESIAIIIGLVLLLLLVDPVTTLIASFIIVFLYVLLFVVIRRHLARIGLQRVEASRRMYLANSEAFGSIKEVKVLCGGRPFISEFEKPSREMSRLTTQLLVIGRIPKYIAELVALGGVLIFSLFLLVWQSSSRDGVDSEILPMLALYAFAGYRLLPAVQNTYQALTNFRYADPVISAIARDLTPPPISDANVDRFGLMPATGTLRLRDVSFSYPGEGRRGGGLSGVSLDLPPGHSLGIIGQTGSGKTTLVDIMLGLLQPTEGEVSLDGEMLQGPILHRWQASIGYVPQSIFIFDTSLARNIALPIDGAPIDKERLRRAAATAQIAEFIENELPDGYETVVGERGVRLSGGQRQRIGLARALYRDPSVLILDEATSAVDGETEHSIIQGVFASDRSRTVVMIAHRLSTIRSCDEIVVLERGRIVARGGYDDLEARDPAFQRLAAITRPEASAPR